MPIPRIDHHTNTVDDAARFEQLRGQAYDTDTRPTRAEIERDEHDLRTR